MQIHHYWNIKLSSFDIIIVSILLVLLFIQLYTYIRYFMGIIRTQHNKERGEVEYCEKKQGVSVIICAKDEEENLRKFLPLVLAQKYPDYEIIVVNDGSTDGTEDYLDFMKKQHPQLKTSFVPNGATNLSTKKLAISIGIKAAKNDWLLLTDADCMPDSESWIEHMVRNFTSTTEFVLGYGGYLEKKGWLNKLIKYDTLLIAIQYMGMAYAHKPYMGVGRNMAYRKSTFERLNGFTGTLNLKSGDDDLLVNRGGDFFNCRIETASTSATWSEPHQQFGAWLHQKKRHLSVSNKYTWQSKIQLLIEPLTRGLFYTAFVVAIIGGGWPIALLAILMLFIKYGVLMFIVNKTAKILGEQKFYLSLPIFDILLPLISLRYLLFGKKNKTIVWK